MTIIKDFQNRNRPQPDTEIPGAIEIIGAAEVERRQPELLDEQPAPLDVQLSEVIDPGEPSVVPAVIPGSGLPAPSPTSMLQDQLPNTPIGAPMEVNGLPLSNSLPRVTPVTIPRLNRNNVESALDASPLPQSDFDSLRPANTVNQVSWWQRVLQTLGLVQTLPMGFAADVARGIAVYRGGLDRVLQGRNLRTPGQALNGGSLRPARRNENPLQALQNMSRDFFEGANEVARATRQRLPTPDSTNGYRAWDVNPLALVPGRNGESLSDNITNPIEDWLSGLEDVPNVVRALGGASFSFADSQQTPTGFNPYGLLRDTYTPAAELGNDDVGAAVVDSTLQQRLSIFDGLSSIVGEPLERLLNIGPGTDVELPRFSDWTADRITQIVVDPDTAGRVWAGNLLDALLSPYDVAADLGNLLRPRSRVQVNRVTPDTPSPGVPAAPRTPVAGLIAPPRGGLYFVPDLSATTPEVPRLTEGVPQIGTRPEIEMPQTLTTRPEVSMPLEIEGRPELPDLDRPIQLEEPRNVPTPTDNTPIDIQPRNDVTVNRSAGVDDTPLDRIIELEPLSVEAIPAIRQLPDIVRLTARWRRTPTEIADGFGRPELAPAIQTLKERYGIPEFDSPDFDSWAANVNFDTLDNVGLDALALEARDLAETVDTIDSLAIDELMLPNRPAERNRYYWGSRVESSDVPNPRDIIDRDRLTASYRSRGLGTIEEMRLYSDIPRVVEYRLDDRLLPRAATPDEMRQLQVDDIVLYPRLEDRKIEEPMRVTEVYEEDGVPMVALEPLRPVSGYLPRVPSVTLPVPMQLELRPSLLRPLSITELPPTTTPVEAALETFRASPNAETLSRVQGEMLGQTKAEYEAALNEISDLVTAELEKIDSVPTPRAEVRPTPRATTSTPSGDLLREYANDSRWDSAQGSIPVRSRSDWATTRANARLAVERLDPDMLVVAITNFVEAHPRAASRQLQRLYDDYRSLMRELAERQGTPIPDDLLPEINVLCPGVS